MPENYPLPLALESFLPVIFSAIGLFFIARMLTRKNEIVGELAYTGSFLIIGGGLLTSIWKLIQATNGNNIGWMKNGWLMLAAPGFVCLAWALWRGLADKLPQMTAGHVWLLPLSFNAGLLALTAAVKMVKGGRTWLSMLLTVLTIASIAAGVQLAQRAFQHKMVIVAGLFLLSLVMSLSLNFRAESDVFIEAAEWAKQISETISQAAFAIAAFQLMQKEIMRPTDRNSL